MNANRMRPAAVLLCAVALAGCAQYARAQRHRNAETEIIEMYRDCLRRKQTDPRVDCSDFRTTIEIREAPRR